MSLKKEYVNDNSICKVTFHLSKEVAGSARTVMLVGEFNQWNKEATPMLKLKDGSFETTLELKANQEYQFRYLLDNRIWEIGRNADDYIMSFSGNPDNAIVIV